MILMCNRARIVFEQMDVRKEKTGFFQAYLIVPFHSAQFYKKKNQNKQSFLPSDVRRKKINTESYTCEFNDCFGDNSYNTKRKYRHQG